MAERLHRTEILLEPEQHQKLADLAEREGRSLSAVVRSILARELQRREPANSEQSLKTGDPMSSLRRAQEEMLARRSGSRP